MKFILKIQILAVAFSISACTGNKKEATDSKGNAHLPADIVNNPATASGNETDKKLPEFTFAESNHDFGTLQSGDVVSHEFVFTNSGTADLIITQATGSCGCTVPEYSKDPIKPGGEGKIKVTFNTEGQAGQVSKTVTLLANTIPSTKVLTISAEVLKQKN